MSHVFRPTLNSLCFIFVGLYKVARYWEAVGQAGYRVYKFDFQRCDPEPAPWHKISPKRVSFI